MNLFQEFPAISDEEWRNKIITDLKGKAFESLQWEVEEGLTFDPYYRADDIKKFPQLPVKESNTWAISEIIDVTKDVKSANKQALAILMRGIDCLLFKLSVPLTENKLKQLLEGIDCEHIHTYFVEAYDKEQPIKLLKSFYNILRDKDIDTNVVKGGLSFYPDGEIDKKFLDTAEKLVRFVHKRLPQFKVIEIFSAFGEYGYTTEITDLLTQSATYFYELGKREIEPNILQQHIQLSIGVDTQYFPEIAKIRAFKWTWLQLMKAYDADLNLPYIFAYTNPEAFDEDNYTNMIRSTTQAASAVLAGVDVLNVFPVMGKKKLPLEFRNRIARNVQLVLKHESYMDRVIDPAAGSYYIEMLTMKFAEQAWDAFAKESVD